MNMFKTLFIIAALFFAGQAAASPQTHPANPDASAAAFVPADYFSGNTLHMAANEHQHEGAASATEEAEGKGCKRGEGKGCCCCKCCDKGEGKEGSGCMRKSGEHDHGDGKKGCGMMKKGMGESDAGKTGGSDAHEGHH
jgi:hypothetical protein